MRNDDTSDIDTGGGGGTGNPVPPQPEQPSKLSKYWPWLLMAGAMMLAIIFR
jgi:hypothetical protein